MQHKQDAFNQNRTASPLILLFYDHNLRPQPQKMSSADKKGVLRGPSWPFVDQRGLRCSPRPSVPSADQKRCSPWPLRGSKGFKVFSAPLRVPPWTKKVFFVVPSWPFVDQRGSRCSPCPSVPLRGQKRFSSCSFVALRGSKGFKVFSAPLRVPPWTKKVFFVVLRGPSWIKGVQGVLRAPPCPSVDKKGFLHVPSWPFVDQRCLRCSPCPSVPLRGQKRFSPCPFTALRGPKGFKVFSAALRR